MLDALISEQRYKDMATDVTRGACEEYDKLALRGEIGLPRARSESGRVLLDELANLFDRALVKTAKVCRRRVDEGCYSRRELPEGRIFENKVLRYLRGCRLGRRVLCSPEGSDETVPQESGAQTTGQT